MVLGWSEFHDLRMMVELDNYIGGEEYEEILAFYPPDSEFRRWSMWRAKEDIVAQPTVGRAMHFTSVAGALESLIPVADEAAGFYFRAVNQGGAVASSFDGLGQSPPRRGRPFGGLMPAPSRKRYLDNRPSRLHPRGSS